MFTGLISDVGMLVSVTPRGDLKRLKLASHYPHDGMELGASVAHNGVCMTLVGFGPRAENDGFSSWHEVDAAAETLAVTTAGAWAPGERINLERALRLGDELGGHMVSGHVDGVAIFCRGAISILWPISRSRLRKTWRDSSPKRARWR